MRLATFEVGGQVRFGVVLEDGRVLDLAAAGMGPDAATALAFFEAGDAALETASYLAQSALDGYLEPFVTPVEQVRWLPPVPQARKLFCLAGNYAEHVREGGRDVPPKEETYPYFFWKPPSTALIGHEAPILYPRIGQKIDYEGELAVVIGRRGRHISRVAAMDHVAGYTILNDISERELASKAPPKADRPQNRFFDWLMGKWFDTAAPCGPWIVTRDAIPDPHTLHLQTRVNGEVRQDASTADMIFSIPELIEFISRIVTLEPGDLIATGTPSGVGSASGRFLQVGDRVEVEIEGIGVLANPIAAE